MRYKIILTIVILAMLTCNPVNAHRMYASYSIEEIKIKSWFGGGTPVKDGEVKVYAIREGKEELVCQGRTNEEGEFVFSPVAGVSEYRVVVEATHMPGHRAEMVLNLSAAPQEAKTTELPLIARIFAGFGYLLGLAGASTLYIGLKLKKRYGETSRNR